MSDDDHSDESPPPRPDLDAQRVRIDALDQKLVELLNARAQIVVEIGRWKRAESYPIYAPHREAAVLRKVRERNEGPLPDRTLEAIFRELMSGSFALEQPLRIGYVGPEGSLGHVAAVEHFGSSVSFENLRAVEGVFTEVRRGHVDYGLVPVENPRAGAISSTLDGFRNAPGEVFVYAEVALSVRHALLANCEPRQVDRIYGMPEDLGGCRGWMSTQYPGVERIAVASVATGVRRASEEGNAAAIGPELAGQLLGLNTLFEHIEDDPNELARFLIISREPARPSGDDKTALIITVDNQAGALADVLAAFGRNAVNLAHLEKRPRGRQSGTDTFLVDAVGHREEPNVGQAIEDARRFCLQLEILGSYPRAVQVL